MSSALRVLLTNDDGIDAPGLAALELAFADLPQVEIWTVAPDRERSTCSHHMTLERPLVVQNKGERRFSTDGFTADCVYFALFGCLPARPDVVVSGINMGPNLGSDVIYSGTVAGAREAVVRGVHGVAVSLTEGDGFDRAAASAAGIAVELARTKSLQPLLLNLNYPAGEFAGPRLAPLGGRVYPHEVHADSEPHTDGDRFWLGGGPVVDAGLPGSDGWLVAQAVAAVSLLSVDQTDRVAMNDAAAKLPFLAAATEGQ